MDQAKYYNIKKIANGTTNEELDAVIVEYAVKIELNGNEYTSLTCSPGSLEALCVGFLFARGLITSCRDITKFRIDGGRAIIEITALAQPLESAPAPMIEPVWGADTIAAIEDSFNSKSGLFNLTGGAHACALANAGGIIYFEEDISRFNALYKTIGKALLDNADFSDKIIFLSCRIPFDMLELCIKCGVRAAASVSAPTDKAIELARRQQITLIGFARKGRMNVYA